MEKIQKEVKNYVTVYVANDGTEFKNAEECEKYEKTAKAVVLAKYKALVVKTTDECRAFLVGCDDNIVEIVKVETPADADTILQAYILVQEINPNEEWGKNRIERARWIVYGALAGDKILAIGRGYDYDSCLWFIGSRTDVISKIDEAFKVG